MKRFIWIFYDICLIALAVILALAAQGLAAKILVAIMLAIITASVVVGHMPLAHYLQAFCTATADIHDIVSSGVASPWEAVREKESFFAHKELDGRFHEYIELVEEQRRHGIVLNDVGTVVNEDIIYVRSWQGVIQQIPGTLTGIGILGTFIGVIISVRGVQFSDIPTVIASIESILSGIGAAFYTSIAGVLLSILFNIINRMLWNVMVREMDYFTQEFYHYIIPSGEEQYRIRQKKEFQTILNRIDEMPKKGDLSTIKTGGGDLDKDNDMKMLKYVQEGLANNEFTFYLQPIFDLNTRKIVGAEALVRWVHPKMGMVSPSVFMPAIEKYGYVTKLDHVIWEQICKTIRQWIDSGQNVVPITINLSQTDILALDVASLLGDLIREYRIPPMYIEVDIAEKAYFQAELTVAETEKALRQNGLRVSVDGFKGDFMALTSVEGISPDYIKLDMGYLWKKRGVFNETMQKAAMLKMNLAAVGVDNMEMMSELRKNGCDRGQGYYLAKPISIANFEREINRA